MSLLGIDLGGTKLATAIFDNAGNLLHKEFIPLENRQGDEVGKLITDSYLKFSQMPGYDKINSVGLSVPGIYHISSGTVWAPNIPGWEDYPLHNEIKKVTRNIPVTIDSDRACCILAEVWQGNAKRCKDAIFLTVGTGIGAGILIDGNILRGAHDIAGAIGWMALTRPFKNEYIDCGCFENYASGNGIAKTAKIFLKEMKEYSGELRNLPTDKITSHHVFTAYANNDALAKKVVQLCIEYWGMACANLVSLFNPKKILFGGGVFGPATSLIPLIKNESMKWAQPISSKQVSFEASALKEEAGMYGAAYLALKTINF